MYETLIFSFDLVYFTFSHTHTHAHTNDCTIKSMIPFHCGVLCKNMQLSKSLGDILTINQDTIYLLYISINTFSLNIIKETHSIYNYNGYLTLISFPEFDIFYEAVVVYLY